MTWLRQRSGTIAWLVMAVAVSFLFRDEAKDDAKDRRDGVAAAHAAEQATDAVKRIEREGLERDFALCVASNEARAGIVTFIDALIRQDGEVSDGEQNALALAGETFAPLECPPDPSPPEDSDG